MEKCPSPSRWGHLMGLAAGSWAPYGASPPPCVLQTSTTSSDFTYKTLTKAWGCTALNPKRGTLLSLGLYGKTLVGRALLELTRCVGAKSKRARRVKASPAHFPLPTGLLMTHKHLSEERICSLDKAFFALNAAPCSARHSSLLPAQGFKHVF